MVEVIQVIPLPRHICGKYINFQGDQVRWEIFNNLSDHACFGWDAQMACDKCRKNLEICGLTYAL